MGLAWLAFFDGLLAITLIAVGIISAHYYMVPPITGFGLFAFGFLLSIIGSAVGPLANFMTRTPERGAGGRLPRRGAPIFPALAQPHRPSLARSSKHPT